jgi:hypothetical protein
MVLEGPRPRGKKLHSRQGDSCCRAQYPGVGQAANVSAGALMGVNFAERGRARPAPGQCRALGGALIQIKGDHDGRPHRLQTTRPPGVAHSLLLANDALGLRVLIE